MSFPAMRPIDALSITHMQRLQHLLQAIVSGRNNYQVNMIAHETVSKHFNLVFVAVLFEPQQVGFAIFVRKKKHLRADCHAGSRDGGYQQILF